jgi:hypothetical protein
MSTATLNVWITAIADPCHIIDNGEDWFVHVVDCEGNVVKWCGKEYSFLKTKCGHLEIEIPPGCYAVFAGHTPANAVVVPPFGNRLTHIQVVRANCGDHVCVTLFSPSLWFCGTWFANAVRTYLPGLEAAGVEAKLARTAVDGVQNLLNKITVDRFTDNLQAFQRQPGKAK